MKKLLSLLMVVIMIAALCACGAQQPAAVTATPTATPTQTPQSSVKLQILCEQDKSMLNTYTLMAVNPKAPFKDANGKVMGFTLTLRADKTNQVSAAELIKTQLESFGIKVALEPLDSDSYNAKTSNKFSKNNITMEAALYGYTTAGMGMGNGLATIYVDGKHAVQGGCQVLDKQFQTIRDEMAAATNLDDYCAAAAKMQDYYAQNTPLLALYWDNMLYAYSSKFDNVTIDSVFGLNNINNWLTITEK